MAASAPVHSHDGSYADWPAIFAGGTVAVGIGLVFASFGAALGLSALSAQVGEGSSLWAMILTGLWAVITLVASYGAGGYIAGRLRRRLDGATADEVSARDAMHGIVVWGLGVIVSFWIISGAIGSAANTAGALASGAADVATTAAQGVGSAVSAVASGATDAVQASGIDLSSFNPIDAINNRLLRGTGESIDPNLSISPAARDVMVEVARTGELPDNSRAILVDEITANSTLSEAQVNTRIDQAMTEVMQLRDQAADAVNEAQQALDDAADVARDAADAVRRATVLTGFILAAAFLIAGASAMIAAGIGGRHRDEGRMFAGFRSY